MIVWKGRFPGASALGLPGSSEKPAPRFCNTEPAAQRPEPKPQYTDVIRLTETPPATTAVYTVSRPAVAQKSGTSACLGSATSPAAARIPSRIACTVVTTVEGSSGEPASSRSSAVNAARTAAP